MTISKEPSKKEPIAIIGIGCHLPGGARSPEAFWQLLRNKTDAIREIPKNRWDKDALFHPNPKVIGRISVKEGGFIDDIDQFDAQFFGIAPIEADRIDPQQRLLLEHTYLAFEDAGLKLEELAGSRTGVFVGISSTDYAAIQNSTVNRLNIGAQSNTGNAASIAANRLSYVFDLRGPSFAVDTACSSGLVAAHLAARSIWSGESDQAVLGGVNIILKPELQIGFSTGGFLAPDARCKTFDARANGYVRSEGVGVLILKPLSKAVAEGDHIYATIIGSALNEDGRTNGIAMPNGDAQIEVMRAAYADAGIDPGDVTYVEAHGTGTAVGDPTECGSIGKVVGGHRDDDCLVGSVKSNIGHLEPASGIAGLIKASLSLHHKEVPPNVHFEIPNPKIDFESLHIKVPTEPTPIPKKADAIYAGINSFGFGGANAHAVLKSYEPIKSKARKSKSDGTSLLPFVLSARSPDALKDLAQSYIGFLETTDASWADICFSAATRRSAHDHRLAFGARDKAEAASKLRDYVAGENVPLLSQDRPVWKKGKKLAFVFSGQGPQWFAMGRELLDTNDIFRKTVEEVDIILKELGWLAKEKSSLIAELMKDEKKSRINETHVVQPALFALQVGLARIWQSLGIEPDGIVGHSIGEVAASHMSGALSLEEATRVVFERSRAQSKASGRGRMLAAGLSKEEAAAATEKYDGKIDIAAVNGPTMLILAGDNRALEDLAKTLEEDKIFNRFLVVDVPFHSYLLDDVAEDFIHAVDHFDCRPTKTELYSTVTADHIEGESLTPEYWARNIRQTVLFYPTVQKMISDGYRAFVEISPHPILSSNLQTGLDENKEKGIVVHSLRRKAPEADTIVSNLAQLFTKGFPIDWKKTFGEGRRYVKLPHYAWQKERFWMESEASKEERTGRRVHPHLKEMRSFAGDSETLLWDIELDKRNQPYIEDHRVQGPLVYPGAGHVDLALAVGRASFGEKLGFLENLEFRDPLFLPDNGEAYRVQVNVDTDQGHYTIATNKGKDETGWKVHSRGQINHIGDRFVSNTVSLDEIKKRVSKPLDLNRIFRVLDKGGLKLGETFKGMKRLWQGEMESLGEIHVHPSLAHDFREFNIHPALLDASFQTAFGIIEVQEDFGVYIPVRIDRVKLFKPLTTEKLYSYARANTEILDTIKADIWIFDEHGDVVAEIQGFTAQYLKGSKGEVQGEMDSWLYNYEWHRKDRRDRELNRQPDQYLGSLKSLPEAVAPAVDALREEPIYKEYFDAFCPAAEEIAEQFMLEALDKLGFELTAGRAFTIPDVRIELKIAPRHFDLFDRMMHHLSTRGYLASTGEEWRVLKAPSVGPAAERLEKIGNALPAFSHETGLLARVLPKLAEVLRGEVDPVQLIFPEEDWQTILSYYVHSHSFEKYNRILNQVVSNLTKDVPEDQTLRVIEIGAGTGGVTASVLEALPLNRTEYVFTDLSSTFLAKAKERFSGVPSMRYKLFDVEKNISAQNEVPHSFDIVIASDVIHATSDVAKTLENVRSLLAPGGVLLMLEVTECPTYLDLIFGMTEGWWLFKEDDQRPDHCTMATPKWRAALEASGFDSVTCLSDVPEDSDLVAQTVFAARNSVEDETASEPAERARGSWVILGDRREVGDRLAARLDARGDTAFVAYAGSAFEEMGQRRYTVPLDSTTAFASVLEKAQADGPLVGVVHSWSLDVLPMVGEPAAESERQLKKNAFSVSKLLSALRDQKAEPALWLVTAGARTMLDGEPVALSQSPILGLGRVVANELSSIPLKMVDLSASPTDDEVDELFAEMVLAPEGMTEEEIAIRGKKRFSARFERVDAERMWRSAHQEVPARGAAFHLESDDSGLLESLVFRPKDTSMIAPDEVEIAVTHSALNFRDVMLASGMLPDEALEGGVFKKQFGLECAGEVTAMGSRVSGLKVGDRVMAVAADTIAGVAVAKADHVVPIPEGMTFEQAATLPMAYLTAYYSLVTLARVRAEDRVLIHAGAGGVGIAAVQIARTIGAEVYATAGRPKHAYLKSLGVKAVFDSRDTAFYDDIMRVTSGQGVDVVLNSLAGPKTTQSLKALAPAGRFVEIGKADIYKNKRVGLRLLADNISYFAVDVDRLLEQRPKLMGEVFREAVKLYVSRELSLHPYAVYPVSDVRAALGALARGEQTGKIVISMKGRVSVAPPATLRLPGNAAYLVAGGTGGFGLETARFLAERGARHLALVSRNGVKRDEEAATVRELEQAGVEVKVFQADISKQDEVQRIVRATHSDTVPLRGVFQSAMVLDDGLVNDMSWEQFRMPLLPKVQGTWNLHRATEHLPLDYFVSFSSIASMYGTPGQSNYAAANSFLDQFSKYRRSRGLAATTINWGVLGSVGFVARTKKVRDFLGNHGWAALSLREAFQVLERAMLEKPVQIGALKTDWQALGETFPHSRSSYRFQHLHSEDAERAGAVGEGSQDLAKRLAGTTHEKRKGILVSALSQMMGKIVGVSKDKVDVELPVTRMGLDSLMANQIRSWLTTQTGIDFTLMQIMQGPSIEELAEEIAQKIDQTAASSTGSGSGEWVVIPKPNPDASHRLFCFSYLGAGASVFNHFADELTDDLELCLVQLPGREDRVGEEPIRDGMALFSELSEAIEPLLDKPYAFYGHSFGGNIAMSFATYMKAVHDTSPEHLFIGAAVPPGVENPLEKRFLENESKGYDDLPDKSLVELLRTLGAPEAYLNDEETLSAALPALRADLEITGQRLVAKDQKLDCPITAVAGKRDDIYAVNLIAEWKRHTDRFKLELVDGGHLFIHDEASARAVTRLISDTLSKTDLEPPIDLSKRRIEIEHRAAVNT